MRWCFLDVRLKWSELIRCLLTPDDASCSVISFRKSWADPGRVYFVTVLQYSDRRQAFSAR